MKKMSNDLVDNGGGGLGDVFDFSQDSKNSSEVSCKEQKEKEVKVDKEPASSSSALGARKSSRRGRGRPRKSMPASFKINGDQTTGVITKEAKVASTIKADEKLNLETTKEDNVVNIITTKNKTADKENKQDQEETKRVDQLETVGNERPVPQLDNVSSSTISAHTVKDDTSKTSENKDLNIEDDDDDDDDMSLQSIMENLNSKKVRTKKEGFYTENKEEPLPMETNEPSDEMKKEPTNKGDSTDADSSLRTSNALPKPLFSGSFVNASKTSASPVARKEGRLSSPLSLSLSSKGMISSPMSRNRVSVSSPLSRDAFFSVSSPSSRKIAACNVSSPFSKVAIPSTSVSSPVSGAAERLNQNKSCVTSTPLRNTAEMMIVKSPYVNYSTCSPKRALPGHVPSPCASPASSILKKRLGGPLVMDSPSPPNKVIICS